MPILVFLDHSEGHVKKNSLEAASYASKIAELSATTAEGIILGTPPENLAELGGYGLKKIHTVKQEGLDNFDAQTYATIIAEAAIALGIKIIVLSNNMNGKAVAPRLSARLKAGLVTGAIDLPDTTKGFVVKKSLFSGKAFAFISISTDIKIISLNPNSYKAVKIDGVAEIGDLTVHVPTSKVKVVSVNKITGEVPLAEAELVISGGRGLKGPENWHLVTDLAKALGAATACSRAVADVNWRPHHEHVGQTGLAIAPNLYFAIGISGAIQHLAGVNRSKVIVVINKDPEAPFFKAADYGIVGDAFEVMPRIIAEVKRIKGV